MGTLDKNTNEKSKIIKNAGYKHVSIYECQLKNIKIFHKSVKNYNKEIVNPINPRDAFHGGRTNETKLLYNFKENNVDDTLIFVCYIQHSIL